MQIHTNVLLSVSEYCQRKDFNTDSVFLLFGYGDEATECISVGPSPELDARINEFTPLVSSVNSNIEFIGLFYAGNNLNNLKVNSLQEQTSHRVRYVLLLELDQGQANLRAYEFVAPHKAAGSQVDQSWRQHDIHLVNNPVIAGVLEYVFAETQSSDIVTAKRILSDKIGQLITKLETTPPSDTAEISSIVRKYSQLKKMGLEKSLNGNDLTLGETADDLEGLETDAIYELTAQVIAKSDERHKKWAEHSLRTGGRDVYF